MPSGSAAIILWILVFVGIFYFLAIRPQRRQKAAHEEMTRMLKVGYEVVTIGGMYGTVTRIGDDWVELEIAKRTQVRFMKRSLASITSMSEDEDEEEEEFIEADEEDVEETDEELLEEGDEEYEDEEYVEEEVVDEEIAEDDDETPEAPPAPRA